MKINIYKSKLVLIYTLIIFFFAILISTRDLSIGGFDASAYKAYFERLADYQSGDKRYEIGYHLFNFYIRKLTDNYQFFLIMLYFTFNLIYFRSMVNFTSFVNKTYYSLSLILFLGLALNSSWYISATVNGLRQGYSLALLFLSLSYAPYTNNRKKLKFLILILISISFHDSTFLVVPFLVFLLMPLRIVILLFLILSIFYPLGLNEVIIHQISNLTSIPLYLEISSYGENNRNIKWVGFQLDLFIYSLFWCLLFIFLHFKYLRYSSKSEYILKVLIMLTSAYFFYGFGTFSNRFGFMSWLFLPIIQTFYISHFMISKIKNIDVVVLVFILILATGFINYYLLLRPVL